MNDSLFFLLMLAVGALFFRSRIRKATEQYRNSESQAKGNNAASPAKPEVKRVQAHQKAQAVRYQEAPDNFGAGFKEAGQLNQAADGFTSTDDQFFSRGADFHQAASLEGHDTAKQAPKAPRAARPIAPGKVEQKPSALPAFSLNPLVQAVIMKEVLTRRTPGKPRVRS